jgi:radical SAM protein with 4Fe4S-binding SPASM domain
MRSSGQAEYFDGAYTRFHLRVDPGGSGLLLANASAALHLSPSGVVIAKGLLDDLKEEAIIAQLKGYFRGATKEEMDADLERVAAMIAALVAPGDHYPVLNLEDSAISPFDATLMAPFQADVAVSSSPDLAPILNNLWRANIPHVTFLAQPEVDHDALVRAIERAEDLGMIAGVRSRATDLDQPSLLNDMALAGLDHCCLLFIAADDAVHDAVCGSGDYATALALFESIQANEVAPVAEVPLFGSTIAALESTLDRLQQIEVTNVNFLVIAAENDMPAEQRSDGLLASSLPQVADLVEEMAAEMDVRFIWQPPVRRDPALTIPEQVRLGPRCTADVSIRVETNADVIPPRGPNIAAGNLLRDDWEKIWANAAFVRYRERVELPTRCEECPGLAICAADCPREPAGWSSSPQGIKQ